MIRIENQSVDANRWQNARQFDFSKSGCLDVWRVCVIANLSRLDHFRNLMARDEIERASRYLRPADQNRMIVSRGAARLILSAYLKTGAANIQFGIGRNGKPFIKRPDNRRLDFNLSHSGDYIAIAVCAAATGVDVEKIDTSFDFDDISCRFFNADEVCFINETHSAERFFLLWTRKEALLKATAKGLDDDLTQIRALDGVHHLPEYVFDHNYRQCDWKTTSFRLTDGYIASVTSERADTIRFADFDYDIINQIEADMNAYSSQIF